MALVAVLGRLWLVVVSLCVSATVSDQLLHDYYLDALRHRLLQELSVAHLGQARRLARSLPKDLTDMWIQRVNDNPQDFTELGTYVSYDQTNKQERYYNVALSKLTKPLTQTIACVPQNDTKNLKTFFSLQNLASKNVEDAFLNFYLRRPKNPDPINPVLIAYVYKYLNKNEIVADPIGMYKLKIPDGSGIWINMRITNVVQQWVKNPRSNNGIMIKCDYEGEDLVDRTTKNAIGLDFHLDAKGNRYSIKENGDICQNNSCPFCSRRPLKVDFEKFGWDWVIAPKRYEAYYCSGVCSENHVPKKGHDHVLYQSSKVNQNKSLKPKVSRCCYPLELGPMKMIYASDDGVVHERVIQDMLVLRCGCT